MTTKNRLANNVFLAFAAIIAVMLPNDAAIAGEQAGKIISLLIRASDGLISVDLEGAHNSKPACAIYAYWMIRAESTLTGKQQYAAPLAAKLTSKPVKLVGSNQCTRWGDGEDIDTLYVLD